MIQQLSHLGVRTDNDQQQRQEQHVDRVANVIYYGREENLPASADGLLDMTSQFQPCCLRLQSPIITLIAAG